MSGTDEDSVSENLSSDEELQEEFAKGTIQAGLVTKVRPPKTYTNNVSALKEKLGAFRGQFDWLEYMDVVAPPNTASAIVTGPENEQSEHALIDPDDDFQREMHFYHQVRAATVIGLSKLEELGVPTERPDDYFAEMVKGDDHMRKVREDLLSRKKVTENREKARKTRELKKYGKKVQKEVLEKRRLEKKTTMDSLKKYKKGKGQKPDFLSGEDDFPVSTEAAKRKAPVKSKKREMKDQKYGYGGKKRWAKSNTAESSADMKSFNSAVHSKSNKNQKNGKKRPGKAKRQQMIRRKVT